MAGQGGINSPVSSAAPALGGGSQTAAPQPQAQPPMQQGGIGSLLSQQAGPGMAMGAPMPGSNAPSFSQLATQQQAPAGANFGVSSYGPGLDQQQLAAKLGAMGLQPQGAMGLQPQGGMSYQQALQQAQPSQIANLGGMTAQQLQQQAMQQQAMQQQMSPAQVQQLQQQALLQQQQQFQQQLKDNAARPQSQQAFEDYSRFGLSPELVSARQAFDQQQQQAIADYHNRFANASPDQLMGLQNDFSEQMRQRAQQFDQQNPGFQQGMQAYGAKQQQLMNGMPGQLGGQPLQQLGGQGGMQASLANQQAAQQVPGRFGAMPQQQQPTTQMQGPGRFGAMPQPSTQANFGQRGIQNAPGQMNSPFRMFSQGRFGR